MGELERTWENWRKVRRRRERGENSGGENYGSNPVQIREVHAEKGVERTGVRQGEPEKR